MPMRIRSTSDWNPVITPHPRSFKNGEFVWNFNSFPNYALPANTSWIRDVAGGRGQNNPVNQLVVNLVLQSDAQGYSSLIRTDGTGIMSFLPRGSYFIPSSTGSSPKIEDWPWIPPISAATLSSWSLEAFSKFQEQIPAKLSLANSLYELKDIKGLIPNVNPRKLKEFTSGNFLAYEFGVLPMISDIKAVVSLADSVQKRIKHLIQQNKKSSHLSFDRDEDVTSESDNPFAFFVSNDDPAHSIFNNYTVDQGDMQGIEFVRKSHKFHFHIGGNLYQDLQGLEDSSAQLKGLLAAGGFNHPARVVWNAIPYSFVVDWFFSVGKLIDTLSVQPFGGTYDISNVMWSVKAQAYYDVYVRWTSGFTVRKERIGSARVKTYERYNGFPAYSVFLTDGTLTPMQQVLALAMIHQRI